MKEKLNRNEKEMLEQKDRKKKWWNRKDMKCKWNETEIIWIEKEILKQKERKNDEIIKKWRINEMQRKLKRNEKKYINKKRGKKKWWNGKEI